MTQEEKQLSAIEAENTLAAPEDTVKKTGLMRGARDFIENTLSSLKGKDMNQAVEEFTGEMTLVIEGMSEDMNVLRRDCDKAAAQLTILENELSDRDDAQKADMDTLRREMEGLVKRMNALEKTQKTGKKEAKTGLTAVLRQATWMVGIFCSAWVLVTLLRLIGG